MSVRSEKRRSHRHREGETVLGVHLALALASLALPLLELVLRLGTLRTIDVIGVERLVLLLLRLRQLLPLLPLLRRKVLPLLTDLFAEIRLALLLYRCRDLLRLLSILTAFASEQDERVLWPLDVVLVAPLRPPFPDIAHGRSTPSMRGQRGWSRRCGEEGDG